MFDPGRGLNIDEILQRFEMRDEMMDGIILRQRNQRFHQDGQNTHASQVTISIDNSTINLADRYPVETLNENDVLQEIRRFVIDGLRGSPFYEGLARIERETTLYTERRFTLVQVLALIWKGCEDREAVLEGTNTLSDDDIRDRKRILIQNIIATRSVCAVGAFHKLIETLDHLHPDVTILTEFDKSRVIRLAFQKASVICKKELEQRSFRVQKEILKEWDNIDSDSAAVRFINDIKPIIRLKVVREFRVDALLANERLLSPADLENEVMQPLDDLPKPILNQEMLRALMGRVENLPDDFEDEKRQRFISKLKAAVSWIRHGDMAHNEGDEERRSLIDELKVQIDWMRDVAGDYEKECRLLSNGLKRLEELNGLTQKLEQFGFMEDNPVRDEYIASIKNLIDDAYHFFGDGEDDAIYRSIQGKVDELERLDQLVGEVNQIAIDERNVRGQDARNALREHCKGAYTTSSQITHSEDMNEDEKRDFLQLEYEELSHKVGLFNELNQCYQEIHSIRSHPSNQFRESFLNKLKIQVDDILKNLSFVNFQEGTRKVRIDLRNFYALEAEAFGLWEEIENSRRAIFTEEELDEIKQLFMVGYSHNQNAPQDSLRLISSFSEQCCCIRKIIRIDEFYYSQTDSVRGDILHDFIELIKGACKRSNRGDLNNTLSIVDNIFSEVNIFGHNKEQKEALNPYLEEKVDKVFKIMKREREGVCFSREESMQLNQILQCLRKVNNSNVNQLSKSLTPLVEFNQHVDCIQNKAEEFRKRGRGSENALRAAKHFVTSLKKAREELIFDFIENENEESKREAVVKFKMNGKAAIDEASPELERHRGWKGFLVKLAILFLGIGMLYGATSWMLCGAFFFSPMPYCRDIAVEIISFVSSNYYSLDFAINCFRGLVFSVYASLFLYVSLGDFFQNKWTESKDWMLYGSFCFFDSTDSAQKLQKCKEFVNGLNVENDFAFAAAIQ